MPESVNLLSRQSSYTSNLAAPGKRGVIAELQFRFKMLCLLSLLCATGNTFTWISCTESLLFKGLLMSSKGVLLLRSTWQQQMAQVMWTSDMALIGACERMNSSGTDSVRGLLQAPKVGPQKMSSACCRIALAVPAGQRLHHADNGTGKAPDPAALSLTWPSQSTLPVCNETRLLQQMQQQTLQCKGDCLAVPAYLGLGLPEWNQLNKESTDPTEAAGLSGPISPPGTSMLVCSISERFTKRPCTRGRGGMVQAAGCFELLLDFSAPPKKAARLDCLTWDTVSKVPL